MRKKNLFQIRLTGTPNKGGALSNLEQIFRCTMQTAGMNEAGSA